MTQDDPARARRRAVLEDCHKQMESLLNDLSGERVVGSRELDARLWQLGKEWLQSHRAGYSPADNSSRPAGGPDVYLASHLQADGGHTALIGDFVRALHSGVGELAGASYLIITDQKGSGLLPEIIQRTAIPGANIMLTKGKSLDEKLDDLSSALLALKPARLFLFNHPEDPLASVVAQPEVAPLRVLVHHSDAQPSFGVYLPEVLIIDLHPWAAANSRRHKISSELLLLTCPDPGPRTIGFLQAPGLTTASCGSQYKFDREYRYGYAETVRVILEITGGRHFHIGTLNNSMLDRITAELTRACIATDRFVHLPHVSNLCQTLWDCECDLYFSSFPIDGARVNVEVAASATPHLRHARTDPGKKAPFQLGLEGSLAWHTWEDLALTLQRLADRATLEKLSKAIRQSYEHLHHPAVFRESLQNILTGKGGVIDPDAAERDVNAAKTMRTPEPGELKNAKRDRKGSFWRGIFGG